MAFEFFKPTPTKVGAALAASASAFTYCLTRETVTPGSYIFSLLLTGQSVMYGVYYLITNYPEYFRMPAAFRFGSTAPAA